MASSQQSFADLSSERARASFKPRELTNLLDGGADKTERLERLRSIAEAEPALSNADRPFLSRPQLHMRGCQKALALQRLRCQLKLSQDDYQVLRGTINDDLPTAVCQCSDEQAAEWLPKALNYEILGCYAQTELGHGSNVRGIETTATYLPETDEFELHTPCLSATKWWIGGLGKLATHAVVYARLTVSGKDCGVQPFLLQIRDAKTHKVRPGILVGDVGPKLGFNTIDNGFMQLNHVRVPRGQKLNRFSEVTADGQFKRNNVSKGVYGSMVEARSLFVQLSWKVLANATTVAVRYSAVRRQFARRDKGAGAGAGAGVAPAEVQVLDYLTQQYKLLPLVATTFALFFTGKYMTEQHKALYDGASSMDYSALPGLHVLASGLKSFITEEVAAGIETCRRCCGGHGYSKFSGLPDLGTTYVHMATAEGENTVLTQQTTRYLLKILAGQTKAEGPTAYLKDVPALLAFGPCKASDSAAMRCTSTGVAALQHRTAYLLAGVGQTLQAALASGTGFHDAWNAVLVEVAAVSHAHSVAVIAEAFSSGIAALPSGTSKELRAVLARLAQLFTLYHVERGAVDLLESGYMNASQVKLARSEVRCLLGHVRPDAVGLVDSFNFTDNQLQSALGRKDGDYVTAMFNMAQQSTLNSHAVTPAYKKYLRPLMAMSKL